MLNKFFKVVGIYFTCVILHDDILPPVLKIVAKHAEKMRAKILEEAKENGDILAPEDEDFLEEYNRPAHGYCRMGF